MAHITVDPAGDDTFRVTIDERGSTSTHLVTASPETVRSLADGATAAALVEASFRFLLDREPKESILPRFDVTVISRYFPDFETELPGYLEKT